MSTEKLFCLNCERINHPGVRCCATPVRVSPEYAVELAMRLLEFAGPLPIETAQRERGWIWAQRRSGGWVEVEFYKNEDGEWWSEADGSLYWDESFIGWLPLPKMGVQK